MPSTDLKDILSMVYQAGAARVPEWKLTWVDDDMPTLNRALNMQYLVRHDEEEFSTFSLTAAGYQAIGKKVPGSMSIAYWIKSWFRGGNSQIDL